MKNLVLIFFALSTLYSCSEKKETEKRPNFLFVLVDDQPFDALGLMGRYPFLQTPNMDRLAKEGVLFTNFFCTQSICSPSRASFLTGTYPHMHGANQNNRQVDPDWSSVPPVSVHLQNAGYQTAHIGKIHMAHLEGEAHIRPGFDYWYSFIGQGEYFDPMVNENGKEYQEKGYMTDILTDKTIDWLENNRDKDKPFYLNLWHKGVHEDHSPAPRHANLYDEFDLPTPPYDTHLETFKGKPEWQRIKAYDSDWKSYEPVDELPVKDWPIKGDKFMQLLRCLKAVDESLGSVMAKLEELGELDNTVIIFSSDNGYFMGEHTYWDKRIAYENSMRIPMIIRYPKMLPKDTKVDEICLNIDLAPTLLEMAGEAIPEYMQGASMKPLFSGNSDGWREAFLFEYYVDDAYPYAGPDMLAVRSKDFKLVDNNLDSDIDELYDLNNDPGEMSNLINDPLYDSLEAAVRIQLKQLKQQYNYNGDRDWWLRQVVSQ
ncbi:MAG: N-acetylglucosamine-6-sulfatase [Marinoscillum sp.]|jgi:N-acetylglucosamine-6-sulfatase